jgi:predicted nucleic acid-binding protein
MVTDGRSKAIIETSVLVNFLKIDRTDLLASHPAYHFVVPDLVRNEVTRHYAAQIARLDAAVAAGQLLSDDPAAAIDPAELAAFAAMDKLKIGEGERAAIAAASTRGLPLAMDDRRAWKRSAAFSGCIPREDTVTVIVSLIKAGAIDVAAADAIKADWQANHRFTLRFRSFAEKIERPLP